MLQSETSSTSLFPPDPAPFHLEVTIAVTFTVITFLVVSLIMCASLKM